MLYLVSQGLKNIKERWRISDYILGREVVALLSLLAVQILS